MKIKALLMTTLAAFFLVTAACNESARKSQADAVKQALEQADLKGVTVSDDADKNTVTLGGTLHSEDAKNRAGEVAKSAAPERTAGPATVRRFASVQASRAATSARSSCRASAWKCCWDVCPATRTGSSSSAC